MIAGKENGWAWVNQIRGVVEDVPGSLMLPDLVAQCARIREENRELRALVDQARAAWIEDNWDGETDCVTPYDVYF